MVEQLVQAIIVDVSKNRFHPAIFTHAPLPGPEGYKVPRYRSRGHHTEGFGTLEEAIANMQATEESQGCKATNLIFDWDGEGTPALSVMFDKVY